MNPLFELPNKNPVTCHVFSLDCVPSNSDFSISAFAQKVRNLCWMLKSVGHRVIYYGFESCDVECDEKVIVASEEKVMEVYPNLHKELPSPDVVGAEYLRKVWTLNTMYHLEKRYRSGDFFFWMHPTFGQKDLYLETANWSVCHIESSIGYMGGYLPYRVFESNHLRDAHYGCYHSNACHFNSVPDEKKPNWDLPHYLYTRFSYDSPPVSDVVIPGYIDKSFFDFRIKKDNYLLYLARIISNKGIEDAVSISEKVGMKLVVAGPGDLEKTLGRKVSGDVEVVGSVGPEKRRSLLSNAKAVLSLSYPIETFGCTAVEGMLSGTVPITADIGGYNDTIRDGYNGYRVPHKDIDAGVRAVEKIDEIDPYDLRYAGLCYSRERVALMYEDYIQYVYKVARGIDSPRPSIYRSWESEKIDYPKEWMIPVDVTQDVDKEEVKSDA